MLASTLRHLCSHNPRSIEILNAYSKLCLIYKNSYKQYCSRYAFARRLDYSPVTLEPGAGPHSGRAVHFCRSKRRHAFDWGPCHANPDSVSLCDSDGLLGAEKLFFKVAAKKSLAECEECEIRVSRMNPSHE